SGWSRPSRSSSCSPDGDETNRFDAQAQGVRPLGFVVTSPAKRICLMTSWRRTSILLLLSTLTVGRAAAVEPGIRNLDVRGLQAAGTTTLTLDGDDLGTAPRLLLPFAVKQERKPGGTDKRVVF